MSLRIGSLCSGYGGLDLGVQAVIGGTVAWHVEYDRDPSRILAHHWPGVPNFGDLKNIDWEDERVMAAPRADALAQQMYDRYCQGLSIAEVGAEFGRSRQTVHKMFARRGWSMRPTYPTERDGVWFCGMRYTLGAQGYMRSTTGDRHLLHRRVWEEHHNQSIPEGYDIHHVDHNKLNNDPANLRLLTKAEHTRLHAEGVVPIDSPAIDVLTAGYPRGRASRSPTPANGRAPMTPDTSGPTLRVPLAHYDPASSSWRTSQGMFPSDWPTSSETLPRWGMTRRGELFELPTAGAPHGRARIFIVASPGDPNDGRRGQRLRAHLGHLQVAVAGRGAPADADGQRHGRGQDAGSVGCLDRPDAGEARQRQRPRPVAVNRGAAAASDADRGRLPCEREPAGVGVSGSEPDRRDGARWGAYLPVIARWEAVLGRPAPAPTEPGRNDRPRLSPRFVEWLMGLEPGHVTDVPGLRRNAQLKALGNGVVPQQAALALRHLLPTHVTEAAA